MTHSTLGTDQEKFCFDEKARARVRREHGIPDSEIVLTFAGRVLPGKDIDVLMQAVAPLFGISHLRVMIVGPIESTYREGLMVRIAPDDRSKVIFTGAMSQNELPAVYSAADIGVWPGDSAVSIIDMMACGRPIIISDLEASRPLVAQGNGRSFPRGDVEALRRAISDLSSDPIEARAMGARSRTAVEMVFNWTQIAERSIQIYRSVLNGQTPSADPLWQELSR